MADRHLNLFYTYDTPHLENNVTRALVVTLRHLDPVHLRLFLRDCLLKDRSGEAARELVERIELLPEEDEDFEFDLQPGARSQDADQPGDPGEEEEESSRLDDRSGFLVGITKTGESPVTFSSGDMARPVPPAPDRKGRPDALIEDKANQVAAVIEVKLHDGLYKNQLRRHFHTYFDPQETSIDTVFHEVGWDDIATYLERVGNRSHDPLESRFIEEFVEYVDRLGLIGFRGFLPEDFQESLKKRHRLVGRFLQRLRDDEEREDAGADERLDMKVNPDNRQIYFEGNDHENVYVDVREKRLRSIVVVGAGSKWRSKLFFNVLQREPERLEDVLDELHERASHLEPQPRMEVEINSRFYYSRFRQTHLWAIGGSRIDWKDTDAFSRFREIFGSERKNAYDRISKKEIAERFSEELAQEGGSLERDSQGLFPKWDDVDRVLQNCSFSIVFTMEPETIVKRPAHTILEEFRELLRVQRDAILRLGQVAKMGK